MPAVGSGLSLESHTKYEMSSALLSAYLATTLHSTQTGNLKICFIFEILYIPGLICPIFSQFLF
jgi:hypothetical protein